MAILINHLVCKKCGQDIPISITNVFTLKCYCKNCNTKYKLIPSMLMCLLIGILLLLANYYTKNLILNAIIFAFLVILLILPNIKFWVKSNFISLKESK